MINFPNLTRFLIVSSFPVFCCLRYYLNLDQLPLETQTTYSYWLSILWSPVLYSGSMYLWGGIMGVLLSLTIEIKSSSSYNDHWGNIIKQFHLAGIGVMVGIIIWVVADFLVFRVVISDTSVGDVLKYNLLAVVAVYQYVFFWSLLAYALRCIMRCRALVALALMLEQLLEIWLMNQYHSVVFVMPAAVSRYFVAMSFPVWRADSWAGEHPSLVGSTPMMFTEDYEVVDVGFGWILAIEGLYVALVICAILWSVIRRSGSDELVRNSG